MLRKLQALTRPPAVLLVEVDMPLMDGVEPLHRMVASGYRARVIITSARESILLDSV